MDERLVEAECFYRGENYIVRSDGSVFRKHREGKRIRSLDDVWSFGTSCNDGGYYLFSGVPVHRIVATAFHGNREGQGLVVDHKNTNRKDNRPSNLRWVTRLENIILNPITCGKIEYATGMTIDDVLKNPHVLKTLPQAGSISWMRTVTEEESHNCYNNLLRMVSECGASSGKEHKSIREYIYGRNEVTMSSRVDEKKYPCRPNCTGAEALHSYYDNLKKGKVFMEHKYGRYLVEKTVFVDSRILVINKDEDPDAIKKWYLSEISLMDGQVHECLIGSYFQEDGAEKYFTLKQGKEWTGGDVFDDYC